MNKVKQFKMYCSLLRPSDKHYFAGYGSGNTLQLFGVSADEKTYKTLKEANDSGKDIYAIVQPSSGFQMQDIKGCRCLFADWDAGTDSNNNYYDLATLSEMKRNKIMDWKQLIECGEMPEPTMIVSTRNGYHIYWLLDDKEPTLTNRYLYTSMMLRIANKLKTDTVISNANRVMRVPGLDWAKVKHGLPPFPTTIIKYSPELIYTHNEMESYYPITDESESHLNNKCHSICYGSRTSTSGTYWICLKGKEPFEVSAFYENGQLHAGCIHCDDPHQHDIVFYDNGWVYCNRCRVGGQAFADKDKVFKFAREAAWNRINKARNNDDFSSLSSDDVTVLKDYLEYKGVDNTPENYVKKTHSLVVNGIGGEV